MTKSVPGPKELAQRELQANRHLSKNGRVLDGPPPKKRGLIPYAGKPRQGADHGIFGQKPGPKRKPGRPKKVKP